MMKASQWCALVATLLGLFSSIPLAAQGPGGFPARPNEVILKFKRNASSHERDAILTDLGAADVRSLPRVGASRVRITKGDVDRAIARYRAHPRVEFIEPNYIYRTVTTPNDPQFGQLWGLNNTGQTGGLPGADIDATLAWDVFTGSDVLVAITDTGIDWTHPDLAANIFVNPGELPGNGIDDDGNGFVDDLRGWDFVNHDNDPRDDHGHGTHVAGTVGAVGDNGIGVAGVSWHVKLLPLKFLSAGGSGTTEDAVRAVDYAVMMGARVINASWGGGGPSEALRLAIASADSAGVLFVAAAGNAGLDTDIFPHYPSSYDVPNIVSVAATDHFDRLPFWSNYGATTVDLAAPGENILSTVPGGYGQLSGTSMATPHVSGALALIVGLRPGIGAADAKTLLLSRVDVLASLAGRVATGGRLNAFMAIATSDSTPPGAISDLLAVEPNGTRVTLRWTATGDDDALGTASRYEVRYSTAPIDPGNFSSAMLAPGPPRPAGAGSAEELRVNGLVFLTTYYFAVKAFDEFGNASPLSNIATATTLGPPDIAVSPTSFQADLLTGGTSSQVLTVTNTGASELNLQLAIESVTANAKARAGAPSVRTFAIPATSNVTTSKVPEGRAPYAEGHVATRYRYGLDSLRVANTFGGSLRVLLLHTGDVSEIRTLLAGFPDIAVADEFDARISTPLLAQLQTYHAVIVGVNFGFADPVAIGDVLADYVDAGGNVVLTLASFIPGFEMQGRFLTGGYSPFTSGFGPIGSSTLGTFDAGHPIMAGVTAASGDLLGAVTLSAGSELVASWANGEPMVATKGTRVAAINVFVAAPGYWTGDIPLILHNAAFWGSGAVTWLSVDPDTAVVPAGGQIGIIVTFDASGLDGGDYESRIVVSSDDPDENEVAVPAYLHVTGAADIAVSPGAIDYGSLFIGVARAETLVVRNAGTDLLTVSGIATSPADYQVDADGGFTLAPRASRAVIVTFRPSVAGARPGTLTVQSDDLDEPQVVVTLAGTGLIPPDVGVTPATLSADLFTGETAERTLTIANTGGSDLDWRIEARAGVAGAQVVASSPILSSTGSERSGKQVVTAAPARPPAQDIWTAGVTGTARVEEGPASQGVPGAQLEDMLAALDANYGAVTGAIPNRYDFFEGEVGSFIGDGGNDMYDGGNFLSTNLSGPIEYSNGVIRSGPAFGAGGRYFTRKHPGLFVLVAEMQGVSEYTISGDLGADGSGSVDGAILEAQVRGVRYRGFVKRVFNAFDPSVNHLVIVEDNPGATHEFSTNTNDDYHRVLNLGTNDRIFYALYAGANGAYIDNTATLGIMTSLLEALEVGPGWVSARPDSGTVPVGGHADVTVTFNATGLFGGDYTADVIVASNDPDEGEVRVPAQLHVTGAPDIALSRGAIDYGSLFIGAARAETLVVSNEGTDVLSVSEIVSSSSDYTTDGGAGFTLAPGESLAVMVTFRPSVAGARPGSLTVRSDDPNEGELVVALAGTGLIPPDVGVTPATLSADLLTGQTAQRTLTIANTGGSDLDFDVSLEATSGVAIALRVTPIRHAAMVARAAMASGAKPTGEAVRSPEYGLLRSDESPAWFTAGVARASAMAGARVLLVEDVAPWGTVANELLLAANGIAFDMIPSLALAGTDLSRYDKVIVPSDQLMTTYSVLAGQAGRLDQYVRDGGVLEFHAAGWGWNGGDASLVTLPGGMNIHYWGASVNDVLDASHPLVAGVPDPFTGTGASHSYFSGIPAGATLVAADDQGRPNLVEYAHGRGRVIAGCQTFEFGYAYGQAAGTILQNMIPYNSPIRPAWLSAAPLTGVVPAGGAAQVEVRFDAAGLPGGTYLARLLVRSNDPDEAEVEVSVTLDVTGAPRLMVEGEAVRLESALSYGTSGAMTTHQLPVTVPPGGAAGTVEIIAEGDYGDSFETATVTVEGSRLGAVGQVGFDCSPDSGAFLVSAEDLGRFVADGVVEVEVQNSPEVDPFCPVNEHRVALAYRGSGSEVDFGAFFVGACRTRTLTVTNAGVEVLTVNLSTSNPAVTVDIENLVLAPAESRDIALTFCPQSVGVFSGALRLQSNDPGQPEVLVALHGEGQTPPDIALAPAAIAEDLLIGQTSSRPISIVNDGGSPLTVQLAIRLPTIAGSARARRGTGTDETRAATPMSAGERPFYQDRYRSHAMSGGPTELSRPAIVAEISEPGAASGPPPGAYVLFFDDMEGGIGGWSHYGTHPNGIDQWARRSGRSSSGSWSWNVSQHDFFGSDALQSQAIDLSGVLEATLSFEHWYDFDDCGGTPDFEPDGGIVEISSDGGTSWQQIHPSGGYPHVLDDICDNPLAFRSAYSHVSGAGSFVPATFDLTPFVGATVLIRFHAGWDCGNCGANEGWYIDDVAVYSQGPRWLSASPVNFTVGPHASAIANISFDASNLAVGSQDAELVVRSNDPDEPTLVVPINLQVADVGAVLDLGPNTLNLGRRANQVAAYLELPPGVDLGDVVLSTLRLNRASPANPTMHTIGDQDGDGVPDMSLKFDQNLLAPTLEEGDQVNVVMTGELAGNHRLLATATIRVTRHRVSTPNGGELVPPGAAFGIRWSVPGDWQPTHADLYWSHNGGVSWSLIAGGVSGTSYDWMVPNLSSQTALVRVILFDELGVIDHDTSDQPFSIVVPSTGVEPPVVVREHRLLQNAPNPFQSAAGTVIGFQLPRPATVRLAIYDAGGHLVRELADRWMPAGRHEVRWDGSDRRGRAVASGVYFYEFREGSVRLTQRMVVLR